MKRRDFFKGLAALPLVAAGEGKEELGPFTAGLRAEDGRVLGRRVLTSEEIEAFHAHGEVDVHWDELGAPEAAVLTGTTFRNEANGVSWDVSFRESFSHPPQASMTATFNGYLSQCVSMFLKGGWQA